MSETEEGAAQEGAAPEFTKEELKTALKAYKKRLKLARLDDESRLGYGAMTKGEGSGIIGVRPPEQFPEEIWKALVAKGRLRYAGQGMYEPADF